MAVSKVFKPSPIFLAFKTGALRRSIPIEVIHLPMYRPKKGTKCVVVLPFEEKFKWYVGTIFKASVYYIWVKYKFGQIKLSRYSGQPEKGFSSGEMVFASKRQAYDFIQFVMMRDYIIETLNEMGYRPGDTTKLCHMIDIMEKYYANRRYNGKYVPTELQYPERKSTIGIGITSNTDRKVERKNRGGKTPNRHRKA
jgi:hypothetical protein